MNEELNDLSFDNTKVTFTNDVNNIATSDELDAPLMYQDKMGTKYSHGKAVARVFNVAGISLILTAAAIKTGTIISNVFVLNPPYIAEEESYFLCDEEGAHYKFTIFNPQKYEVHYVLEKEDEEVLREDCSEEKTYEGTYQDYEQGQRLYFYVEFTNRFDYSKRIWQKDNWRNK